MLRKKNQFFRPYFLRDLILEPEEKKTNPLKFSPFLHNEIKYSYTVEFNRNAVLKEELNH